MSKLEIYPGGAQKELEYILSLSGVPSIANR